MSNLAATQCCAVVPTGNPDRDGTFRNRRLRWKVEALSPKALTCED
jgi:hypothetical protein